MRRDSLARRDSTAKRDTTSNRPRVKGDSVTIAVPVPPQPDTPLADSLRKRDSTRTRSAVPLPSVPKDTIKAPLAHSEAPPLLDIGDSFQWDRAALFATGALTVQDLLDRVPGISGFRAGWLAAPMTAAYLGDVGRIRIFYDGLELDNLDPHSGALDLTLIQIWTLEEARIERGADELRLYLRSWRVDRTTPSTRTDIATGDQQTNLYRGFFGRRYEHGEAIQAAAQQYGTTPGLSGASSDMTSLLARVGWSRSRWSVDGFALRTSRHRGTIYSQEVLGDSLPGQEATRTDAYLRVGYGDPDAGPWAQFIAGSESFRYTGRKQPAGFASLGTVDTTSAESTFVRPQYVFTGGFTRWGIHLTGAERFRSVRGSTLSAPSLRAAYTTRLLSVMGYLDGKTPDSVSRTELSGRFSPFYFVSVAGTAGRSTDHRMIFWHIPFVLRDTRRTTTYSRAEIDLRLKALWFGGGVLRRGAAMLPAPAVYDTLLRRTLDSAATGTFATIRGRLYQDLYADLMGIRWRDTAGFYRPRYESRSEIGIRTAWLRRFPSGNFGLHFALIHTYRSNTYFPTDTGTAVVHGWRTISSLVEIRILQAVASFQMRNMLGERYGMVPSFAMPRQTTIYGVRWDFWN